MDAADIHATILTEVSSGMFGSNNKLTGYEVSDLVRPAEHPVGGHSETSRD